MIVNQKIKFVEREDFIGLPNLEYLNLNGNEIEFLSEDVFGDLKNLRRLGIRSNKIKHFSSRIFEKLTNVNEILTYGNKASTNSIDFSAIRNVQLRNETDENYYQGGIKFQNDGKSFQ